MKIIDRIGNFRKNSFFNHSKNYLIAEIFNNALIFITIPFFTRMLTPEEYGIISVFSTVVALFSLIFGLNLSGAVSRKYYEEDTDFSEFLGTNIVFMLFMNGLLFFLLYLFRQQLADFFAISNWVIVIAMLVSLLGNYFQVELAVLQIKEDSKKYAQLSIVRNLLMTVVAIIWVMLLRENRYLGRINAQLIITVIIFFSSLKNLNKIVVYKFSFKHIKYALNFGVPLLPHVLSGFILAQFGKIIINQVSGNYEAGLYSFAYNVGMIMGVVTMAVNRSWIPIFFKNLKEKNIEKIQIMAEKSSKIIYLVALLLIIFSEEVIMILANEKYFVALKIVPIIILGYVFLYIYTLYCNYSFYYKKTGWISIMTFIAGIVNILLCYGFIPKYGYIAGAWATLISYILLSLLHYLMSKYLLKENVINPFIIVTDLFLLILSIILFKIFYFDKYLFELIFKLSIVLLLFMTIYRKEIYNKIKSKVIN